MHLIMGPVTEAVWNALAEKRPFGRADYLRRLACRVGLFRWL